MEEIKWAADNGFDFLDLTLEPTQTYARQINPDQIRQLLETYHLGVVGHTAYYLPFASPFPSLREVALKEFLDCLEVFARLGAFWVNIHPDSSFPNLLSREKIVELNLEVLRKGVERAQHLGLQVMLENLWSPFDEVETLRKVFSEIETLMFHLDVGHANLHTPTNKSEELVSNFRDRLVHVHFSDNRGGWEDLHLPLGAGNINWEKIVKILKKAGYDETITLEVFSSDRTYLLVSRDKIRRLWESTALGG